jgi:hypothetical protein
MLKTQIWLYGRRGLVTAVVVAGAAVAGWFGHCFHGAGFFDG